jgi:hypothetical protein
MPSLYDSVELLVELPELDLRAGMQGAIVYQYDKNHFEVEFTNKQGETEQLCALGLEQFIVVWQAETKQPVSIIEQVSQIVARLPQIPQRELLDFARFLGARAVMA